MAKKTIICNCKNPDCNKEFDKQEVKRVYGQNSIVYQANFCSAQCYTNYSLKNKKYKPWN